MELQGMYASRGLSGVHWGDVQNTMLRQTKRRLQLRFGKHCQPDGPKKKVPPFTTDAFRRLTQSLLDFKDAQEQYLLGLDC